MQVPPLRRVSMRGTWRLVDQQSRTRLLWFWPGDHSAGEKRREEKQHKNRIEQLRLFFLAPRAIMTYHDKLLQPARRKTWPLVRGPVHEERAPASGAMSWTASSGAFRKIR